MQARVPPSVQHLSLASHVRGCHSDGQVILLDLRHNKYLGVGGKHLPALAHAIEGWPGCPSAEHVPVTPADLDALTRPLLSKGLLTDQPFKRLSGGFVEEAISSLDAQDAMHSASIGPRRLYRFLRSAAAAAMSLRYRSLGSIADAVASRRARLEKDSQPPSADALRNAVAAYEKLRPLVFTARDKCLYDSLALVNFLAYEGIFARWVIGVQTRPFGAHSWAQSGGIVLNDQHDHVRRFCPILVV